MVTALTGSKNARLSTLLMVSRHYIARTFTNTKYFHELSMSILQNINIHGLLHRHHTIIMAPAVRGIQKSHQFGHHCRHYLHHRKNIERSFKNICRPDNSRNLCQVFHAVSQHSEVGRGLPCHCAIVRI